MKRGGLRAEYLAEVAIQELKETNQLVAVPTRPGQPRPPIPLHIAT